MALSASSPEVRAFVRAFEENQNVSRKPGYRLKVIADDRKKYIAVDEVDEDATPPYHYPNISHRGGRFLIDRADGTVYGIRGYGQRGYRVGNLERMTREYDAATATYDPSSRIHVGGRHSPSTTDPAAIREVLQSHSAVRRGFRPASPVGGRLTPAPGPAPFTVIRGGLARRRRIRRSARR
jgi:hypothetical protein